MTSGENARLIAELGVSHLGYIHYSPSPRHVAVAELPALVQAAPEGITRVLVTVN